MDNFQEFQEFDDITDFSPPFNKAMNCFTPNTKSPSSPDGITLGLDVFLGLLIDNDVFNIESRSNESNTNNTSIESNESSDIATSIESNNLLTVLPKSHLERPLLFF